MSAGNWWKLSKGMAGAGTRFAGHVAEDLTVGWANRQIRPSRAALKTGILCPGDGPPSGSLGAFQDYREILLPEHVAALQQGTFPVGKAKHPRGDRGAFDVFFDWEEVRRHVAIVGPPGSGKTFSLLAPWAVSAASHGLTTITVDVKGDLRAELTAAKSRLGITTSIKATVWDIDDPSKSRSWNPLTEVTTTQHAAQIAQAFLGDVDPNDVHKWFAERDHRWLRGLVTLLVATAGHTVHPNELYRMVVHQPTLVRYASQAPGAAVDLLDLLQFPDTEYARATSGLSTKLSWLADPALNQMLSGAGPRAFTLEGLLDSGRILIVGGRLSGGERSSAAAALLLNLLRLKCMERFTGDPAPVFWLLDEAPQFARRIQLDQMLNLLRGANSPVVVAMQDVGQFGDEGAQNKVLSNCDTFITLRGASDATSNYFSKRLGTTQMAVASQSLGQQGRWTPTISHTDRPLLGQREIMYPPVGRYGGVVQVRSASPHPFLITFE